MGKMKKIGICVAAVAGAAGVASISAKAVESMREKWFLRGFEAGQFIGSLTATENLAHENTVIKDKYNKLCEEYDEIKQNYKELCEDYYGEDDE